MVGFHMCSWHPWFSTLHIPWFLFDVEALALRISGLACRHGRNQFQLSSGFLPAGLHGQKMARAEGRALGWGERVMWFSRREIGKWLLMWSIYICKIWFIDLSWSIYVSFKVQCNVYTYIYDLYIILQTNQTLVERLSPFELVVKPDRFSF